LTPKEQLGIIRVTEYLTKLNEIMGISVYDVDQVENGSTVLNLQFRIKSNVEIPKDVVNKLVDDEEEQQEIELKLEQLEACMRSINGTMTPSEKNAWDKFQTIRALNR